MSLENNPFVNKLQHKHGAVPFDTIKLKHFIPALNHAIAEAEKNLESIKNNSDPPTFENTALPMESGTELMETVAYTYFNLMGAESDNKFKELAQKISPTLSVFKNKVLLDSKLFERVKTLYENKDSDNLTHEQKRLIEEKYTDFIHNGALLNETDKEKVRQIDEELSKLAPKFSQNTLNATNDFTYHTDDAEELIGLPDMAIAQAAETAKKKEQDSGWMFTLQMPSYIPVMQFADNRNFRETIFKARSRISFGGKYDNQEIVKQSAALRYEKAIILGFEDHADYTLQKRMAGKTDNVMNFLDQLYEVYYSAANRELNEMRELAKKD